MKLHGNLTINKRFYAKGEDVPWLSIYPFFLFHMLVFGGSGFAIAYLTDFPETAPFFLYVHGGFAVAVYTFFYVHIFGPDEVKWMFINAGLGLLGIYSQIGWLLSLFDRNIGDYPMDRHVIPFLYFVLYTFLIRQAILDITQSREDEQKKKSVEYAYIAISVAIYGISYYLESR